MRKLDAVGAVKREEGSGFKLDDLRDSVGGGVFDFATEANVDAVEDAGFRDGRPGDLTRGLAGKDLGVLVAPGGGVAADLVFGAIDCLVVVFLDEAFSSAPACFDADVAEVLDVADVDFGSFVDDGFALDLAAGFALALDTADERSASVLASCGALFVVAVSLTPFASGDGAFCWFSILAATSGVSCGSNAARAFCEPALTVKASNLSLIWATVVP